MISHAKYIRLVLILASCRLARAWPLHSAVQTAENSTTMNPGQNNNISRHVTGSAADNLPVNRTEVTSSPEEEASTSASTPEAKQRPKAEGMRPKLSVMESFERKLFNSIISIGSCKNFTLGRVRALLAMENPWIRTKIAQYWIAACFKPRRPHATIRFSL